MLWYLLSPIRGTTQPPALSSDHPIRRAFYRHGKLTAQHWLLVMLASVAIAVMLCYPTVFLSANPTAGIMDRPHQVWTTQKHINSDSSVEADVEIRQVWIHGSHMKALEKDVLKKALEIQQSLLSSSELPSAIPSLGTRFHKGGLSWAYHSPLMYWNNSAKALDEDDDILRTINEQSRASSSLNVALRPASVFAGKYFDGRKLKAADGLVLSFLNKAGADVAPKWETEMEALKHKCLDCRLYPEDGIVRRSRVFEFGFVPLSFKENVALGFAYGGVALYVLLSLLRLRAFHSRFGLVVTAITQVTTSILSSCTICSLLNINLASIPQNAYPFVVMVIGLENMFRLINAVLAYPPTMATENRIGNALGDIGPLKIATAGQNLLILWILSLMVSPGVAAFCAFASIATLFDTFFLLTFFVAVLNVDIRRLELQDALVRSNNAVKKRKRSPARNSWFDALLSGRLPFSTRMAGTVVTAMFVLSLNFHFFEHQDQTSGSRYPIKLFSGTQADLGKSDAFVPPPMNATLTLSEWMKMQDFETAREIMRLVKPGATSFIMRVFAPLVVVLAGADRTGVATGRLAWKLAFRSLALHHLYTFAAVVVFVVTFVAVLMNFLLWNEATEEGENGTERASGASLAVQTLTLPHKLDIVKMFGCSKGQVISIGLDRSIAVSVFVTGRAEHSVSSLPPDMLASLLWPIHQVTIDDAGDWLAFHCADDSVRFYSRNVGKLLEQQIALPDDHATLLFKFTQLSKNAQTYFLVVSSGGRTATLCLDTGETWFSSLTTVPLLGASLIRGFADKRLVAVTDEGSIVDHLWTERGWLVGRSQILPIQKSFGRISGPVNISHVEGIAEILAVIAPGGLALIKGISLAVISHIGLELHSAGRLMLGAVASCPSCGAAAFRSVTVISDGLTDGDAELSVIESTGDDVSVVCFKNESPSCPNLGQARASTIMLPDAGNSKDLTAQSVLGLRRRKTQASESVPNGQTTKSPPIRNRRRIRKTALASEKAGEGWEAYQVSIDGEVETIDASADAENDDSEQALLVNEAGPAVAVDSQSVAVAFGNSVKVVRSTRRGSVTRVAKAVNGSERQSFETRRSHAVK